MQIKNSAIPPIKKKQYNHKDLLSEKKVDINILLNRVKVEKQDAIKKNFIITAGALGTLAITGLISLL